MFSGGQNGTKQIHDISKKSLVFYLRNGKYVSNPGGGKEKKKGVIPEADCEQTFQYLGGKNKNLKTD